jgi:hypothetical protein
MKSQILGTIITTAVAFVSANVFAQHYTPGTEGIKAATLPPPGIYLEDYNFFRWSDGSTTFGVSPFVVHQKFESVGYLNEPRIVWITDWKILGANYGMDLVVPFGYRKVEAVNRIQFNGFPLFETRTQTDSFGLGDVQIEPLLLSWHLEHSDFTFGYAVWAPSGNFESADAPIGLGFWTHMLTFGWTLYVDENKTWALSVLNRYEINHEQQNTEITYGQLFTMEWGLSKTVWQGIDVGAVGYWQQQVTKDESSFFFVSDQLSHVVAVGPEVSANWPNIGLTTSVRYLHEFEAKDTLEGDTVVLTLRKGF